MKALAYIFLIAAVLGWTFYFYKDPPEYIADESERELYEQQMDSLRWLKLANESLKKNLFDTLTYYNNEIYELQLENVSRRKNLVSRDDVAAIPDSVKYSDLPKAIARFDSALHRFLEYNIDTIRIFDIPIEQRVDSIRRRAEEQRDSIIRK